MKKTVPEMLHEAAGTYKERNLQYGENYKNFGPVVHALFPKGIAMFQKEKGIALHKRDLNRLGILVQIVSKLTRYCTNFDIGGHDDSLKDLAVYATMLRELDAES